LYQKQEFIKPIIMKLAIVTAYPPSKVTLNEYGYHLVKHLRQRSEISELILLTDRTQGEKDISFPEEGCKIIIKECWTFNSCSNLLNITMAMEETKPDAVLLNLQFMKFGDKKLAAALGLLLPLVCKILRIPNIVLLHNILEEVDLKNAGFTSNKWLEKLYGFVGTVLTKFILHADLVAVTMHKYVKTLKHKYYASNIAMIPHGTFEVSSQVPNYKLPKGPLQIMAFGKFGTYKKVEGLIEAVEKVRKSTHLELEIVIAGTDNPNAPGYLKSVQEKYKHIAHLRFTGYVAEEDVSKVFNESAVVVFPYTATTGSSGVLHQAGSYGKAVVMPNLGDLKALIEDEGYKGEYFEPSNTDSLAKAIENIVTNNDYRMALGKTNFKAANAFPMKKITKIYLYNFREIIKEKRAKSAIKKEDFSILK